jgi:microcystin-dependent protein
MHRIDSSGSAGGLWQSNVNPTTQISADWMNDTQENLVGVLTAAGIAPVKGDYGQLAAAIATIVANAVGAVQTVPTGAIAHFDLAEAPAGWVAALGQAVPRTGATAAYFAKVGTRYGAGDGSTTYNLPNLQGEFLRALDISRGVDPGRTLGSFQADELAFHTHSITSNGITSTSGTRNASGSDTTSPRTVTTNGTGGNETRPRNVAYLVCIKL